MRKTVKIKLKVKLNDKNRNFDEILKSIIDSVEQRDGVDMVQSCIEFPKLKDLKHTPIGYDSSIKMMKEAENTKQKIIEQLEECNDEEQLAIYLLSLSKEIQESWGIKEKNKNG